MEEQRLHDRLQQRYGRTQQEFDVCDHVLMRMPHAPVLLAQRSQSITSKQQQRKTKTAFGAHQLEILYAELLRTVHF